MLDKNVRKLKNAGVLHALDLFLCTLYSITT